jgi:hypothetical protein
MLDEGYESVVTVNKPKLKKKSSFWETVGWQDAKEVETKNGGLVWNDFVVFSFFLICFPDGNSLGFSPVMSRMEYVVKPEDDSSSLQKQQERMLAVVERKTDDQSSSSSDESTATSPSSSSSSSSSISDSLDENSENKTASSIAIDLKVKQQQTVKHKEKLFRLRGLFGYSDHVIKQLHELVVLPLRHPSLFKV